MLNNTTLALIGSGVVGLFIFLFKWVLDKSLSMQLEQIKNSNIEGRKEREYDQYLTLKGQQVIADCLHEVNYAVLNGTHNGELEKANKELDQYRSEISENLTHKAARWNMKIN